MAAFFPVGERLGRVHAWLLDDGDGLTLIDALGSRYAVEILKKLSELNRQPGEIKRIILSHAHLTHVKGAWVLKRMSGARVHAPLEEKDIIEGQRPSNMTTWIPRRPFRVLLQQYMLNLSHVLWKIGIRPELLNAPAVYVDQEIINDDERIGPVIVMRTPGHSPGSTSFYWPEEQILFAGDAIVTWPRFALGWPGLTEDVPQNIESVRRLVAKFDENGWPIKTFATGHGPPLATDDGLADLRGLLQKYPAK